jgi:hypothetical protein
MYGGSGIQWGNHRRAYQAEGHLPAVSVEAAEKIRDFLLKRIKSDKGI